MMPQNRQHTYAWFNRTGTLWEVAHKTDKNELMQPYIMLSGTF